MLSITEIAETTGHFLTEPWALLAALAAFLFAIESYLDEWLLQLFKIKDDVTTAQNESNSAVGQYVIISGLFGFVVAFTIWSVLFWSDGLHSLWIEQSLVWQAIGIGFMELIWIIPYMYAVDRAGALATAPLMQLIPVFSLLFGFLLFDHIPPIWQLFGISMLIIGSILLNVSIETKKVRLDVVLLMMTATSLLASIYFLFKDVAIEGGFWTAGFWVAMGTGLCAVFIWFFYRPYRLQFNAFVDQLSYKALAVNTINETSATVSVLTAQAAVLKAPSVAMATALNAYQPVFVLLIGWVLGMLGSGQHKKQLSGRERIKKPMAIVLIALGTVLISFD